MAEVGQAAIDRAKADGSWSQPDQVDAPIVPPDLRTALDADPGAVVAYESLGDSAKKQYLWWIHSAKRPTTRTMIEEWAYITPYQSNTERSDALADGIHTYNHHRNHTAIGGPPISRVTNQVGQHN